MALPLFASILLGTVASKVVPAFATKKLGMDPTQAALLGAAAGFGAGAFGSGVFSGGASSFGSLAGAGSSAAGGFSGAVGGGGMGASAITSPMTSLGNASWAPYAFRSASAPSNIMSSSSPDVMSSLQGMGYSAPQPGTLSSIVTASNGPSAWDRFKSYATSDDSQRFLGNAASTLIEGLMQEKPRRPMLSGGGGGGGGGMAPAYGGGGGGQVGVTWGFGGQQGGYRPQPIT